MDEMNGKVESRVAFPLPEGCIGVGGRETEDSGCWGDGISAMRAEDAAVFTESGKGFT